MPKVEAEFISCSDGSRDAKWFLQLQNDIHNKDSPPLPTNCNIHGPLTSITTGIIIARTKHIEICDKDGRDEQLRRIVDYSYVHTNFNEAYIHRKAFTQDKHMKFMNTMRLR